MVLQQSPRNSLWAAWRLLFQAFYPFGGDSVMDDFDQSEQSEDTTPLPEATVQDYLMQFVAMLASQTWVRLGLMVNPSTGKQETDLEQARLAINVIEYLIDQLEPGLAVEARRELNTLESNLKLNYVERKTAEERAAAESSAVSDDSEDSPADA
jgi:hypothetical protein